MNDLKNLHIGIFGYGSEGQSLFKYLIANGCKNIKVFDEKLLSEDLKNGSVLISGKFEDGDYAGLDIVFRSPGVRAERLKQILPESVEISSPTNLFFENCRAKTIGVTGTKGKSTTVLLVAELLRNHNKKVFTVGNIGDPMLDVLLCADENSYCIVELSSFQLQDLEFKPETAIILPIEIDHLDYHKDADEYFNAKKMILGGNDQTVICDKQTAERISIAEGRNVVTYSLEREDAECLSDDGKFSCSICGQEKLLAGVVDFALRLKIPLVDLLAAFAFSSAKNFDFDLERFANFKKLPMRVELVAEKSGVKFFNDSASTNPISTTKAIQMMNEPYVLIMGGSSKGIEFDELAEAINRDNQLKKVFLFGETANSIEAAIRKAGSKQVEICDRLGDVFGLLKNELSGVGSVLFSPASASFDQYKNYKQRGDDFNLQVVLLNE